MNEEFNSDLNLEDEIELTDEKDEEIIEEQIVREQEEPMQPQNNSPVFIHTKFGSNTVTIQYVITATGQYGNTSATGGKLRLIYGRIYFLPVTVDEEINSDNYGNMKVFSDMADKIDVKFIAKGHAAILPLQNNINIQDNTRLCALW